MKHLDVTTTACLWTWRRKTAACGARLDVFVLRDPDRSQATRIFQRVDCDDCLFAFDLLVRAGLATVEPHKSGSAKRSRMLQGKVVVDPRAFPHAPTRCIHRYIRLVHKGTGVNDFTTSVECTDCGADITSSGRTRDALPGGILDSRDAAAVERLRNIETSRIVSTGGNALEDFVRAYFTAGAEMPRWARLALERQPPMPLLMSRGNVARLRGLDPSLNIVDEVSDFDWRQWNPRTVAARVEPIETGTTGSITSTTTVEDIDE